MRILNRVVIPSGVKADSFGFSAARLSDSMLASRRFAMRPGIELRQDYDAARLRALAKATRNAGQSRRLLALAEIYDGGSRTKAARVGGVGLQTVRDWVVKFNARGPEGLINGKAPGNACRLMTRHREALVALVESGPIPAVHGVVRWRLKDLVQWLWDEFRIAVSETTLSRELHALGYRKLSARPRHHAKSEAAVAIFKKSFPRVWRKSRRMRPVASR
jgi:transposase